MHALYSVERLRSILCWKTKKTTLKNTGVFQFGGSHEVTISYLFIETIISTVNWKYLKILRFRIDWWCVFWYLSELPDVQAGFSKVRGTRDQIANIHWIMEKAKEFQKKSISALLTMPKPLTMWITINCGKFWKRLEYQTTWSAFWEIYMQVRKQQLELDMEQQSGSK